MKPAEKIERLIKKSRYKATPETYNKALGSFLQAVDEHIRQKSAPTKPIIRRIIMKNPFTKLAAAAVIIIAALLVMYNTGPSSVALADVLAKVEQAKAYIYKMNVKVTGPMMPGWPMGQDMTGTVTISKDLGIKTEMEMIDPNTGETTRQENYIIFD